MFQRNTKTFKICSQEILENNVINYIMDGIKNYNTIATLATAELKLPGKPKDENGIAVKRNLNINNDEDIPFIKNALKNYIKIEERHVSLLPSGCYIRYIHRDTGDLMKGSTVYKQYDPLHEKYQFILCGLSTYKRFFHIRKDRYIFFAKDKTVKEQIAQEKDNLYKLYKQGLLKLVENEDEPGTDIRHYCDEYYCD